MRRRDFLAATSAAAALAACGSKAAPPLPPGRLTGANDALGHRLRKPDFPAPTETLRTTVAIATASPRSRAAMSAGRTSRTCGSSPSS